jgi:hypothetical protein
MQSGEQIKKTSKKEEKAEWFFHAMKTMDKLLDDDTKKQVRGDCACCLGGKRENLCKMVRKEYQTPEERIHVINETHYVFGHEIKIIGAGKYEVIFFDEKSPAKKCSCLKVIMDKEMSKTYCYCCGNHIKHHLETVLGKKLNVELVTSALSSKGKNSCRFVLEEIKHA